MASPAPPVHQVCSRPTKDKRYSLGMTVFPQESFPHLIQDFSQMHFLSQNFPAILFLKWQFPFQHSPSFFLLFLILYHYTMCFTCLFILFTVCLLSCPPPPKDKLLHDKEFWVFCSLIKFQCLRQSVVNSICPVNICQIVNKKKLMNKLFEYKLPSI